MLSHNDILKFILSFGKSTVNTTPDKLVGFFKAAFQGFFVFAFSVTPTHYRKAPLEGVFLHDAQAKEVVSRILSLQKS